MLEATSLHPLVDTNNPVFADEGSSGLEERVQCGVLRADMEVPLVESDEVSALGGCADRINEPLEGGGLSKEFGLELASFLLPLPYDLADLVIASAI